MDCAKQLPGEPAGRACYEEAQLARAWPHRQDLLCNYFIFSWKGCKLLFQNHY